jgi:hypothetical protein
MYVYNIKSQANKRKAVINSDGYLTSAEEGTGQAASDYDLKCNVHYSHFY